MERLEIIETIKKFEPFKSNRFIIRYSNRSDETKRLFYSPKSDEICEYADGKSTFGYPLKLDYENIIGFSLIKSQLPTNRVRHVAERCLEYLNRSGLWKDKLHSFIVLRDMKESLLESLIFGNYESYRELCLSDENYNISEDMFIGLLMKGIKTIRYETYSSDKEVFSDAIKRKESEFSLRWRKAYDNSLHLRKDENGIWKAWYSEEFKDCGNGHYYLALDETHVIHIEDD